MKKYVMMVAVIALILPACVSKKLLRNAQQQTESLRADSIALAANNASLKNDVNQLQAKVDKLNSDIASLRKNISSLSTEKGQTEEELQREQLRLRQLQNLLAQQRSQSKLLKDKMSEALKGFNSNDLSVLQKNGKVYVSLSENLLFPSGSAVVNPKGVDALSKLAAVLNLNGDVAVNIEGHADSIPIRGRYKDNWELSTARSAAIVRILVNNYKVDPVRVIASGHSYFDPIDSNTTAEGRAKNRRTEIILSPNLEEMYKLLENDNAKN